MHALRWALRAVDAAAAVVVVLLVVALLALVGAQFLDRYVIHRWQGFPAEEYIKVGIVWLTFIGFGLAVRRGMEIRVDLIDAHLPQRLQRWLFGAFDVLTLAVVALVLVKGLRLYQISALQTILGTDMTLAVPVLGMLLGCALVALAVALRLLRRFTRIEL